MDFPESFFLDEVREGFYISGMMKRVWAAQMEVLAEIDRVCKIHGIRWFADIGTLLGAVRHKGFIPWDDDLDIVMLRDDFERFHKIAAKSLKPGYRFLRRGYGEFQEKIARVINGITIDFGRERLEAFHDCPYAIGVDIFVLDYLTPNEEEEELRRQLVQALMMIVEQMKGVSGQPDPETDELLRLVEDRCGVHIERDENLLNRVFWLIDDLSRMYPPEGAKDVTHMFCWANWHSHRYSLSWFRETVQLPFEHITINAPADYDDILKVEYGDYHVIRKGWAGHQYPFYSGQEKMFLEKLQTEDPFHYHFVPADLKERRAIQEHTDRAKEVFFLPFAMKYWEYMEPYYRKEIAAGNEVYVMPLPYDDLDFLKSSRQRHYDLTGYPRDAKIIDYRETDLEKRHPDVIYTQYPKDEHTYTYTVPIEYYTARLRECTDELICIPWFRLGDVDPKEPLLNITADQFIRLRGLMYADRIFVENASVRELYIENLVDFCGEDTREVWENKVVIEK